MHGCIFNCHRYFFLLIFYIVLGMNSAIAQKIDAVDMQGIQYGADYFEKYKPNTALDIVKQIPGFILDDINDSRGYGASAGNVLINGRRPSSKEDMLSAIKTIKGVTEIINYVIIKE